MTNRGGKCRCRGGKEGEEEKVGAERGREKRAEREEEGRRRGDKEERGEEGEREKEKGGRKESKEGAISSEEASIVPFCVKTGDFEHQDAIPFFWSGEVTEKNSSPLRHSIRILSFG